MGWMVFAIGATVGGVIVGVIVRARAAAVALAARQEGERAVAALDERLRGAEIKARELYAELEKRDATVERLAGEKEGALLRVATLETRLENASRSQEESEKRLREAFEATAAKALQANTQQFVALAKSELAQVTQGAKSDLDARQKAIDVLLKPVEKTLTDMQRAIQEMEQKRAGAYQGLLTNVKQIAESHRELGAQTAKLVTALRQPSVRGRWGEMQLRRVIEMAGMLDHCDFKEQQTGQGEDGRLRPDVVVRLVGGRCVVVDSKAPLSAYLDAHDATDEVVREAKLEQHARQVRAHMTELSKKDYAASFGGTEFVVMFLPGEAFFSAALAKDPTLIEYGVDRKVIPASPTTLIALLQAIAYGWSQAKLAENAQAISEHGADLYKRLQKFADHFSKVGRGLSTALGAYNDAAGSLESRVLASARKLKDLGAGGAEEIEQVNPIDLVPRALQADEFLSAIPAPVLPLRPKETPFE